MSFALYLYFTLDIIYMYFRPVAILAQSFTLNDLVDLGLSSIYIDQARLLRYCFNGFYLQLYT